MSDTVLIDLGAQFAAQARKGEMAGLKSIADQYNLALGLLCPRRDNCATVYLSGAAACTPDVLAAVRAIDGVDVVTAMPKRERVVTVK